MIAFLLGVLFLQPVQAQRITVGLRGGLSSSSVKMNDMINVVRGDTSATQLVTQRARVGGHIGLWSRFNVAGIHLQPEVLLTALGGDVTVRDIINGQPRESIERLNLKRMDLNILAGYSLGPLHIQAGPVASWVTRSKEDLRDFKQNYNKYTIGYLAGIGLDIGRIGLDVRYEGNLSRLANLTWLRDRGYQVDQRVRQTVVSLAYRF